MHQFLREEIELGSVVIGERWQLAERSKRAESRLRLDGELIERKMIGRERNGLFEFRAPGFARLSRPRIDEIEGEARKIGARQLDRASRLSRRMLAAKKAERGILERLNTKRQPINACRGEAGKARRLARCRIGFERNLDISRRRKECARFFDDGGNGLGCHQRGRAAAKEDRVEPRPAVNACSQCFKLGEQCLAPTRRRRYVREHGC